MGRGTTLILTAALTVSLVTFAAAWRPPGDNKGYAPAQPIAFSHRVHAGDLRISCFYCHSGAESSRYAGIPAANVCMNCHVSVTATLGAVQRAQQAKQSAPESKELRKLYDALALDDTLAPIDGKSAKPIVWRRVHTLPQFVYFDHRAHITAQVACRQCHGLVETMDTVRQFETLAMGWCVNCHRDVNQTGVAGKPVHASTDCVTCHY